MIEVRDLAKRFGEKEALRGVSFRIPPGEIFVLLGPNGAGKTTTIRLLSGLLRPTSGAASVGGHDIAADGVAARSLLAYIPEEPHLYERLTGREFLRFVGELYGMERERIEAESARLAERLGCAAWMDELAGGYSHGMRQRIVIAAALLHAPKAIVVDEPMVGLDPRSARVVKDILREEAARGAAILMSTHTLPVAEELADRIGILHQGRMAALGRLDEIRATARAGDELEAIFLRLTEEGETG